MLAVQRYWNAVKRMTMTDRQQVAFHLTLRTRQPFKHPKTTHTPTVDYENRCKLENLGNLSLNLCGRGLSSTAKHLILDVLASLVSERKYTTTFAMSQLHGFSDSKCIMWNYRQRASQRTMADMGALVDDLDDLKGLEGGQIIDACKAWHELRLDQGICLHTDNWHQRFYWGNKGGSHHMAVLCYQLQQQKREWRPDVEIHEANLDVAPLAQLAGKVSVFVVMDDHSYHGSIFEELPSRAQHLNVEEALGVALVGFDTPSGSDDYQLLLIDHSGEYSDLSLGGAQALVDAGHAMRFADYLLAWQMDTTSA